MQRRLFLSLMVLAVPGMAAAQPATPPWRGSGPPRTPAERTERHEWLEQNWDSLPSEQRRQAEERFRRGMGAQGPEADQMRQRWQSMTPNQRREMMFGHRMGRGNGPMGPGRMGPSGGRPGG